MIRFPLLQEKTGLLSGIWGTAHLSASINRIKRAQTHIANICKYTNAVTENWKIRQCVRLKQNFHFLDEGFLIYSFLWS